jgi:hypothetical protein
LCPVLAGADISVDNTVGLVIDDEGCTVMLISGWQDGTDACCSFMSEFDIDCCTSERGKHIEEDAFYY